MAWTSSGMHPVSTRRELSLTSLAGLRATWLLCTLAIALGATGNAAAAGGRLLATGGVLTVEGAGGGGLVPWALIAGYGTRDEVGGAGFATYVDTGHFDLRSAGGAVGLYNRLELSFAHQHFDLGDTVPGQAIEQQIVGAKLRVWGDAVYDQDRAWPQIAVGMQYKRNLDFAVPALLGAEDDEGIDFYVAATRVWLGGAFGRNLLVNVGVRATRANQFGLLCFGGDAGSGYSAQAEGSVGLFITDALLVGGEWRTKPDNLGVFEENDAFDVYVAWLPHKQVALTAAWVDLGRIADQDDQDAAYLSLQVSF